MKNSGVALHMIKSHALQDRITAAMRDGHVTSKVVPVSAVLARHLAEKPKPYPFTLWLDYRVPSLNTILGRVRRAILEKKKAQAAVAVALSVAVNYPRNPAGRMHVIVTCYVIKQRDADNPVPKFVIDQLRYQGVLRDDDPGSMALTVNPDVKVAKKKLEGTKITIVEALP